ncbi:MAG: hypothetical protein M1816_002848 [Peltula sp. TS41687]|nr:MAG: hypothetical protein M1816_002848 [Peltula sp. TS41687]
MSRSTARQEIVSETVIIAAETTSMDASNVSQDHQSEDHQEATVVRRVLRARRSLIRESYNESIISGSRARRTQDGNRTISGETFVNTTSADAAETGGSTVLLASEQQQSVKPDAELDRSVKSVPPRRMSTRLEGLVKAKDDVKQTLSVLGKRGRDAVSVGKRAKVDVAEGLQRRASLRPRVGLGLEETKENDEPVSKKAKIPVLSTSTKQDMPTIAVSQPVQPKPKVKRWLSHGLYVGQHRGFDGRLTESKNRLKAAASENSDGKENSILPLPMFNGERLLDTGRDFKLPYDIFSPLPPGQPKPEEWKKTQKNFFVGDAASFWKSTKLREVSKCICQPESGCGEDCQNRFMYYECDDSNCNIGAENCTNRAFEDLRKRCKAGGKFNIGVEVMQTSDRGYGVRSNRQFEPNQIIVEYAGEIITQEECDNRMNTRYKDNNCYYLMQFDQNMIIDATRGSIARFVNHSCEPNCRIEKWTVAGKPRMALFAGEKGIMTGDELTYDYNFDPFSAKNVQQCRCGSAQCRGVLGPKPKEAKSTLATNLLSRAKTVKRKIHEVIGGDPPGEEDATKRRKHLKPRLTKPAAAAGGSGKEVASTTVKKTSSLREKISTLTRPAGIGRKSSTTTVSKTIQKRSDETVKNSVSASGYKRGAISKTQSVKAAGASIRKTVVRSLRGSRRVATNTGLAQSGSTVRLVEEVVET